MKKAMIACDLSDPMRHTSHAVRHLGKTGGKGQVAATTIGRRISPLIVCAVFALVGCSDKPDAGTGSGIGTTSDVNAEALAAASDAQASAASAISDAAAAKAAAADVEAAAADVEAAASEPKATTSDVDTSASAAKGDEKTGTPPAPSEPVTGHTLGERGTAALDQAGKGVASLAEGGGALLGSIGGRLRDNVVGAVKTSDATPDTEASARTVAIPFGFDTTTFSPVHAGLLDSVVASLLLDPARHATLSGHADRHGAAAYNRTLARARAEAVRDHLLGRGVAAAQLTVRSDVADVGQGAISNSMARRVDVTLRASGDQG